MTLITIHGTFYNDPPYRIFKGNYLILAYVTVQFTTAKNNSLTTVTMVGVV